MGRICKICSSPHHKEYDKLRLEGTSIKDIVRIAYTKHSEKHLKYFNFQKHFANHVETLVSETIKANQLRDKVVRETIKRDIEIVKTFSRNLQLVTNRVETISKEIRSLEDIKQYGELFLKFVGEARYSIEQYLKWSTKLEIQETTDDLFHRIIRCMHDFPPEYLEKFASRWEQQNAKN